jgi:hypothetical protein
MSRRISLALTSVLVLLSVAAASAQGLYWESKVSGGPGALAETSNKSYAVPGLFKHANEGEQGYVMIMRMKGETVAGLDPKKKAYWEMSFSDMEAEMKKMENMMNERFAQIEKQLAGLPPEQKKAAEKQFEAQKAMFRKGSGKVEVTNTGEKKTLLGYSATKFTVKEDGKDVGIIWASRDVKGFKPLEKDLSDMMKRVSSLNPSGSKAMSEAYLKIEGFPLEMDVGGLKTTVTKVEERAIPPAEFEVPKEYTKGESPFAKMGGPPGSAPGQQKKAEKAAKPD